MADPDSLSFADALQNPGPISRVLVIRSGQVHLVESAIATIEDQLPGSRLEILCQPAVAGQLANNSAVNAVHVYKEGFFKAHLLGRDLWRTLRQQRFDLVVAIYSNSTGMGYEHVRLIGRLLTPRRFIVYLSKGFWIPIELSLPVLAGQLMRTVTHRVAIKITQAQRSLGVPLSANERRIRALKNRHSGKRAFILGTGPSLRLDDMEKLKNEITFGCNKVFVAFRDTDFRPTYYSVYDTLVGQINRESICELQLPRILIDRLELLFPDDNTITYLRDIYAPPSVKNWTPRFSENLLHGIYGGGTVIFMQMQIALYMGIRELYLIGVDFHYEVPKPTGERLTPGGSEIVRHDGEENHFHRDYRSQGEKWFKPKLEIQYLAFKRAKTAFEERGGRILNASRKTALDVFPCVDFDSLFEDSET